jgi:hypothetical protein
MAAIKNAFKPLAGTKYKKKSPRKPLHERKTSLEIPIKMGAVIAVAQARKCSLKDAASWLKIALQNHWILHQREIVCTAYLDASPAMKDEQFFKDLQYNETDFI